MGSGLTFPKREQGTPPSLLPLGAEIQNATLEVQSVSQHRYVETFRKAVSVRGVFFLLHIYSLYCLEDHEGMCNLLIKVQKFGVGVMSPSQLCVIITGPCYSLLKISKKE